MTWWMWIVLGLVLASAEMFHMGFFLIFFGVAGVVVGLLSLAGISGPPWMEWVEFSAISIISMLLFRKPIMEYYKLKVPSKVDELPGELAVAMGEIAAQGTGKAELRGSPWNAKNIGEVAIRSGQQCRVERLEGLVLYVRAE